MLSEYETILHCRRKPDDDKWLALSVSANTPRLRAEREARYILSLISLHIYMQHAQNSDSTTIVLLRSSKASSSSKKAGMTSPVKGSSLRWESAFI